MYIWNYTILWYSTILLVPMMGSMRLHDIGSIQTARLFLLYSHYFLLINSLHIGSQPTCITGVLNWVHGNYQLLDNGSIICTPFGDGYQQIQDPCAAQSNFVENYNDTELYQSWNIYQDTTLGVLLQMYEFDGSPLAPMGQVSAQPNMLPTQMLRNVTPAFTTQDGFVSTGNKLAVSTANGASRQWSNMIGASTVVSILLGSAMFALVAL